MAGVSSGSKANGSTSNNDKSKSDQSASKVAANESQQNLDRFLIWCACVAVVVISYTFHGCVHYSCSAGVSNVGPSLRPKSNPKLGKYLGSFPEVWGCEHACINQNIKKGGKCWSYTFMVDSTDAKSTNGHCYGNFAPMWDPVEYKKPGVKVLSGRHYSWTPYSVAVANFISLDKFGDFLVNLRDSVKAWPIIAGVRAQFDRIPSNKYTTASNIWTLLSVLAVSWPLVFLCLKKGEVETTDANGVRVKLGAQANAKQNSDSSNNQESSSSKSNVLTDFERFVRLEWIDFGKKTE